MASIDSSQALPEDGWDPPEIEVLRGVEIPKIGAGRTHALLQGRMAVILSGWAEGRGDVGIEWRFNVPSIGDGERSSLLPDVAYIEHSVLLRLSDEEAEAPSIAPTIAVEIRSPHDREANVAAKMRIYLEGGSALVLDVDPKARRVAAHDAAGLSVFEDGATFVHVAAPGFTFDVSPFFDFALLRRA
jgi:Uma2 family endonuclease